MAVIAGLDFNLGYALSGNTTFDFLEADGGITGFDPLDPTRFTIFGSYTGYSVALMKDCSYAGGRCDLDLVFTRLADAVPEPGTALLMSLGLLGLTGWRLRPAVQRMAAS